MSAQVSAAKIREIRLAVNAGLMTKEQGLALMGLRAPVAEVSKPTIPAEELIRNLPPERQEEVRKTLRDWREAHPAHGGVHA